MVRKAYEVTSGSAVGERLGTACRNTVTSRRRKAGDYPGTLPDGVLRFGGTFRLQRDSNRMRWQSVIVRARETFPGISVNALNEVGHSYVN